MMAIKKNSLVTLLIVVVLAAVSYFVWQKNEEQRCVEVGEGTFNLSDCRFSDNHTFKLDGDWSFYWQQTPSAINAQSTVRSFQNVPSYWSNRYFFKNDYAAEGYATYRATVRIPNKMISKPLAIRINGARTASELYVNGQLLKGSGKVGNSRNTEVARNKSYYGMFVPTTSALTIDIFISNYQNAILAGLNQSVIIGNQTAIEQLMFQYVAYDLFVLSVLMCMTLFFFGKWLNDTKWNADIWFALLLFAIFVFTATQSEKLIYVLWPTIDFDIYIRLNLLSAWIVHAATLMFVSRFYPVSVPRVLIRISNGLTIFVSGLILLMDSYISLSLAGFMVLYGLSVQFYSMYVMIVAWRKKSAEALYMFFAIFIGLCYLLIWIFNLYFNYEVHHLPPIFMPLIVILLGLSLSAKQKAIVEQINETELAKLRHQIKPHFLFNALNTIKWASQRDSAQAVSLIGNLTRFLRGSFDFDDREPLVSLGKELELVQEYLEIEKVRFGKRLRVEWQMDERLSISQIMVPSLIIQPLVENAVRHGATENERDGWVRIEVTVEARDLLITIQDNGLGFSEQQLLYLQRAQFEDASDQGFGIGLKNIQLRLMNLYGRTLNVINREDGGACVMVRIPLP
jgi:signal transduction histidine kinase